MQEETIVASPSKLANQQQLCYIISELQQFVIWESNSLFCQIRF